MKTNMSQIAKWLGMGLLALVLALVMNGGAALAAPATDDGIDWDAVCKAVKLDATQCAALKKAATAKPATPKSTDKATTTGMRKLNGLDGVLAFGAGKGGFTPEFVADVLNTRYAEDTYPGPAIGDFDDKYNMAKSRGVSVGIDWSRLPPSRMPYVLDPSGCPSGEMIIWNNILRGLEPSDKAEIVDLFTEGTYGIRLVKGGTVKANDGGRFACLTDKFDETSLDYSLDAAE